MRCPEEWPSRKQQCCGQNSAYRSGCHKLLFPNAHVLETKRGFHWSCEDGPMLGVSLLSFQVCLNGDVGGCCPRLRWFVEGNDAAVEIVGWAERSRFTVGSRLEVKVLRAT